MDGNDGRVGAGSALSASILEIDAFEAAFPVRPGTEDETLRRFSTLFVEPSSNRAHGTYGYVCKARNAFGERFAIKRLHGNGTSARNGGAVVQDIGFSATPGTLASFRLEYENQLQLSRLRGFPRLYGWGESADGPVIVMEWVEGVSWAEARASLPAANGGVEECVGIPGIDPLTAAALGSALFATLGNMSVLARRSVHRDLSPSNVMVRTSRTPLGRQIEAGEFDLCIIDFGSMTAIDEYDPGFTQATSIIRRATPEYAAPEMLADTLPGVIELRQSPSIDVYAACSMLYELLAGRPPFDLAARHDANPYEVKMSCVPEQPAVPERYRAFADMVMSGLSVDQTARPAAAQARDVCDAARGRAGEKAHADLVSGVPAAPTTLRVSDGAVSIADVSRAAAAPAPSRGMSRRAFVVAAGVAGACVLGGAWGLSHVLAPQEDDEDDTAAYTGGALYGALDAGTGRWGYVNAQRKWVIEPKYSRQVGVFSSGIACVIDDKSGLCGYIDSYGQWTIPPRFTAPDTESLPIFMEDLTYAISKEGEDVGAGKANRIGFIDAAGNWAVAPQYFGAASFGCGLAPVLLEADANEYSYIDKQGSVVLSDISRVCGVFSEEGLAYASRAAARYGWIDTSGNWAIEPRFYKAASFSEGLAGAMVDGVTEQWGFVNTAGNLAIEAKFAAVRTFKNGFAPCKDAEKLLWGIVDTKGGWTVAPKFADMGWFNHGLAPAKDVETQLYGYVDDTGEWVIPPQFSMVNMYQAV